MALFWRRTRVSLCSTVWLVVSAWLWWLTTLPLFLSIIFNKSSSHLFMALILGVRNCYTPQVVFWEFLYCLLHTREQFQSLWESVPILASTLLLLSMFFVLKRCQDDGRLFFTSASCCLSRLCCSSSAWTGSWGALSDTEFELQTMWFTARPVGLQIEVVILVLLLMMLVQCLVVCNYNRSDSVARYRVRNGGLPLTGEDHQAAQLIAANRWLSSIWSLCIYILSTRPEIYNLGANSFGCRITVFAISLV